MLQVPPNLPSDPALWYYKYSHCGQERTRGERPEGANVGREITLRGYPENRAFLIGAQMFRWVTYLVMILFHKGGYKNRENLILLL